MGILVLEADLSRPAPFLFSCFRIKTLVQTLVLLAAAVVEHTFVQKFAFFAAETGLVQELGLFVHSGQLFAAQQQVHFVRTKLKKRDKC